MPPYKPTTPVPRAVSPPHPLAHPPAPAPKPVITHPHTITVRPDNRAGPLGANPMAAPAVVKAPNKITVKSRAPNSTAAPAAVAGPSLQDQIDAQVKAELDPQTTSINSGYAELLAGLKAQQQKAQLDAAAQAQTIQGYYGALTPLLQGIAPAVQGGYQDAANSIAGAAKGFSGALGDTATADAAQSAALLGANGAPMPQVDAAAQAAGTGGGAANALYGLGGFIPSAELSAQGAAAGAAARQLPATFAGVGAQNAAEALGVGAQNVSDIGTTISQAGQKHADDLATLLAGVPKLRNDISGQLTALQTAKDATAYAHGQDTLNRQAAAADAKQKADWAKFTQILSTGIDPITGQLTPQARAQIAGITGTDPTTGQPTISTTKAQAAATAKVRAAQNKAIAAATKTAAADAKPNASLSRAAGVIVDSNGNKILDANGKQQVLPGFKVGKDGNVIKAATAKPAGKVGANPAFPNLTKSQVQHLRAGVAAAFNGVTEHKDASGKLVREAAPKVDYQTAINHAIAAGYSRAGATKMANRFYMPGQRGRPARRVDKNPATNPNAAGPPAP